MEIFGLGAPELLVILVIFLLFFGKDRLPQLARSIGKSFKELKDGFSMSSSDDETKNSSKSTKNKE